jgi:hypothetical protein
MWSVYATGQGIEADLLPEELRPRPLDESVDLVANGWPDGHDISRKWLTVSQLGQARGLPPGWLPRLLYRQLDRRAVGFLTIPPLIKELLASLAITVKALSDLLEGLQAPVCLPLSEPQSQHFGVTLNTTATAVVHIMTPLHKLVLPLDPRRWSRCSSVFLDTHRVKAAGPRRYVPFDDGTPLGAPWHGLLYELVDTAAARFENILSLSFEVERKAVAAPGIPGDGVSKITITHSLYDSLSCDIGLISAVGGMRKDSGSITAEPCGCHRAHSSHSKLTVCKTVNYRDLAPRFPGFGFDYGKIVSYLAPAALCMWTEDLGSLVPCCDADRSGST